MEELSPTAFNFFPLVYYIFNAQFYPSKSFKQKWSKELKLLFGDIPPWENRGEKNDLLNSTFSN